MFSASFLKIFKTDIKQNLKTVHSEGFLSDYHYSSRVNLVISLSSL